MSSPLLQHLPRKRWTRASSSLAHDVITSPIAILPKAEPSFICTICWQPQYPSSGPSSSDSTFTPKLLGSSARIVCHPCWRAVLDLSICWVCGECIVRGDEVVSLGWCFWHKECFGCLVCGSKMSIPRKYENNTPGNGKRSSVSISEDEVAIFGHHIKGVGVDLDEIPLCGVCEIETAGESQGDVLERGLDTVSRFDGGLSRDRLDMLSEERGNDLRSAPRSLVRLPRRLRGATGIESELKRYINGSSHGSVRLQASESANGEDRQVLLMHAADMGVSEDGLSDVEKTTSWAVEPVDSGPGHLVETSDVYVSIFDPVNEPAFRPNKTKPLPKWMSLLPINVERSRRQHEKQLSSSFKTDVSEESAGKATSTYTSPSSYTPRGSITRSEVISPPIDIPISHKRTRTISFMGDERGTHDAQSLQRSLTLKSTYHTPPEFPRHGVVQRELTPFPRLARPSLERDHSSSYFTYGASESSWDNGVEECPSIPISLYPQQGTPQPIEQQLPVLSRPSQMVHQSSEYLDRYQPKTSSFQHRTYIAKQPEPVVERIKRQQTERNSSGQTPQETLERDKIDDIEIEQGDPRRGLQKELRNLFYDK